MSLATDAVGPRPLIDLHAAGLKVGQTAMEAVRHGFSGREAERETCRRCPFAAIVP